MPEKNKSPRVRISVFSHRRLRLLLFVFWITLCLYPVNNGQIRSLIILITVVLWFWAVCICWKKRVLRYSVSGCLAVFALIFLLPARYFDSEKLRQSYVSSLKSYEGSIYWWGGENKIGIDCSGLIRKGMIMANLKRGLLTFNGAMLRHAGWLWWNDASARYIKSGYEGKTKELFTASSINQLDHSKLMPGDFAVTGDGSHTLAYIGDNKWIQACPGEGKVVILASPDDEMGWYMTKVHIMRWTQFQK